LTEMNEPSKFIATLQLAEKQERIAWYDGASNDSVRHTIAAVCGVDDWGIIELQDAGTGEVVLGLPRPGSRIKVIVKQPQPDQKQKSLAWWLADDSIVPIVSQWPGDSHVPLVADDPASSAPPKSSSSGGLRQRRQQAQTEDPRELAGDEVNEGDDIAEEEDPSAIAKYYRRIRRDRVFSIENFINSTFIASEETTPLLKDHSSISEPLVEVEDGNLITKEENFRLRLIKLERINAHCANERTFLAFVRVVVSMLSIYFNIYWSDTSNLKLSQAWKFSEKLIGTVFGFLLPLIIVGAYVRYNTFKNFLEMTYSGMIPFIGTAGLYQTIALITASMVIAVFSLAFIGKEYISIDES